MAVTQQDSLAIANTSRVADLSRFLQGSALVGGAWVEAAESPAIAVANPANGTWLGSIPDLRPEHLSRAVEFASQALDEWRSRLAKDRAQLLRGWGHLIEKNRHDLAALMTLEQGKPIAESLGEIDYGVSFIHWFAEESTRLYGDVIPTHLSGSRLLVTREPVGVCVAITPWNFPSAMVTRKAAAALAAGCPVIVQPSRYAPFSALALGRLALEAGLPSGVLQVVTGDPGRLSEFFCAHPSVRKISFTGSTAVGRKLLHQCADSIKRVTLELGGHAPFIVFRDADLEAAVQGCIAAKFATTGQDCLAANKILVEADLYSEFARRFATAVSELKVGDGFEPGVRIGPLMHERAVAKCRDHIADALSRGATLLTGGHRHPRGPLFFEPTAIGGVTPAMKILNEETFGPVAPLMPFASEQEAIQLANASEYGLAAYFYTADLSRMWRVAEKLEYGMVALNTPRFTGAPIPFGGYKQSGIGREGSRFGIEEYTELKYFCVGGLAA